MIVREVQRGYSFEEFEKLLSKILSPVQNIFSKDFFAEFRKTFNLYLSLKKVFLKRFNFQISNPHGSKIFWIGPVCKNWRL